MRPFRFFFGLSIAVILFLFVARIFFFAFIVAAVLSILFAVVRRIKDFITYDRNGDYYIPAYNNHNNFSRRNNINQEEIEPLFYEDYSRRPNTANNIQFVDIA